MKKWAVTLTVVISVLITLTLSARVDAFSEEFKREMTDIQRRVMLNGEQFSIEDARQLWSRYDDEIIGLLSRSEMISEEELNLETQKMALMVTEKKGTEIEPIELGDIAAQFQQLDTKGEIWLVVLHNGMYQGSTPLSFSTFRVYKRNDGSFTKTAALEDVKGKWNQNQIESGIIQIQNLGGSRKRVKFATYHTPPKRSGEPRPNRSKIVWEYGRKLKAVKYVPKVD